MGDKTNKNGPKYPWNIIMKEKRRARHSWTIS